MPDTYEPAIGVIVIGRDEGERLRRCLASVHAMHYPASLLEIFYVDSRSTDGSLQLAQSMGARAILLEGRTSAARARNAAWPLVAAPFVLFLDGDTILDPNFVRAALPRFEDPTVAAIGGHRRELDAQGSIYNAVFDIDWITPVGPKPNFGGDALVRTEALRKVGGFNSDLIGGEEPEISRRMRSLGYTIHHIDAPMTMHDLAIRRFSQYWRRSLRTGYAYAEVSSFFAGTPDPLWKRESRHNLIRGLFWTSLPILTLAASLALQTPIPTLLFAAAATLIIGRTAWNARRHTSSLKHRLAYGAHSHLQHIALFIGQLKFWAKPKATQDNKAPGVAHP